MPKPDHPPAMLFYPVDFSADSKVEAMTTEGVGAYILLLCKAWREEPPGSLPDNDPLLARWARLPLDRWEEIRPLVLAPFTLGTDSRWHQKRMRHEFEQVIKRRRLRIAAGKLGADVRWQTHGNAMRTPQQRLEDEYESEFLWEGKGDGGEGNPFPLEFRNDPEFRSALKVWCSHRSQLRGRLTPTAIIQQRTKMIGWGVPRAIAAMLHSAGNGWQGLFEPDETRNGKSSAKSTVDRKREQLRALASEKP